MIVIETKLKKLPEKCNQCKYSRTNSGWSYDAGRFCSVSFKNGMHRLCPIEFVKEKRNWEFQRPDWCPLREVNNEERT